MSVLRSNRFARTIAVFCVAIVCAFSVQATIVNLDRIEHALDHDHDANPVAGSVQHCGAGSSCKQSGDPHHGASHVHVGDTVVAFTFSTAAMEILQPRLVLRYLAFHDQALPPSRSTALDRPPKA